MRKEKKILAIIDMQNDFINGTLGNSEAQKAEKKLVEKLQNEGNGYRAILLTKDIHNEDYEQTFEGQRLSVPHCIKGTDGRLIDNAVYSEINKLKKSGVFVKFFTKHTFTSNALVEYLKAIRNVFGNNFEIEFVGLHTDTCVISNVLATKAALPETVISVDSECCAGVSEASHLAALQVMRNCQVDINMIAVQKGL